MRKNSFALLLLVFISIVIASCSKERMAEEKLYTIQLSSSFPNITYTLAVPENGWYYLNLDISGKYFKWNNPECPSVVLDAFVEDNNWMGSILLWNPNFSYSLFMGKLNKGSTKITIEWSGKKSPCQKGVVEIKNISLSKIKNVPEQCLLHYPYLLGYEGNYKQLNGNKYPYNAFSDFPMFWVCDVENDKVSYILYYSNEDFGTGFLPAYLMYSWGRTADIENAFTVDLQDGKMYKRDNEEEDTIFDGDDYNNHPLLQIAPSDHGLVTEGEINDKSSQLLFAPMMITASDLYTREDALDIENWSYLAMEWEMEQEKKISTDPETLYDQESYLAPLNYYLYMDMFKSNETKIGMKVILKNGKEASNATDNLAWDFSGWKRVVLKLPEEVEESKIKEINLVNLGGDEVKVVIRKMFYLGSNFESLQPIFSPHNPVSVTLPANGAVRIK